MPTERPIPPGVLMLTLGRGEQEPSTDLRYALAAETMIVERGESMIVLDRTEIDALMAFVGLVDALKTEVRQ